MHDAPTLEPSERFSGSLWARKNAFRQRFRSTRPGPEQVCDDPALEPGEFKPRLLGRSRRADKDKIGDDEAYLYFAQHCDRSRNPQRAQNLSRQHLA